MAGRGRKRERGETRSTLHLIGAVVGAALKSSRGQCQSSSWLSRFKTRKQQGTSASSGVKMPPPFPSVVPFVRKGKKKRKKKNGVYVRAMAHNGEQKKPKVRLPFKRGHGENCYSQQLSVDDDDGPGGRSRKSISFALSFSLSKLKIYLSSSFFFFLNGTHLRIFLFVHFFYRLGEKVGVQKFQRKFIYLSITLQRSWLVRRCNKDGRQNVLYTLLIHV